MSSIVCALTLWSCGLYVRASTDNGKKIATPVSHLSMQEASLRRSAVSLSLPEKRLQVNSDSRRSSGALAAMLHAVSSSSFPAPLSLRPFSNILRSRSLRDAKLSLANDPNIESVVETIGTDESRLSNASMQQIGGLAGLAGSAAAASAISTAGGVCVGGGCAVAGGAFAGASATAAGTGIAAGAAGLQSLVAGVAIALASAASILSGGEPANLQSMAASATSIEVAASNGQPTVIEFYRKSCTRCNQAAPQLAKVEKLAKENGVNWVMLDTDNEASTRYIRNYGVYNLPHFEFIDAGGSRKSFIEEDGPVDIDRVAKSLEMLQRDTASAILFPSDAT